MRLGQGVNFKIEGIGGSYDNKNPFPAILLNDQKGITLRPCLMYPSEPYYLHTINFYLSLLITSI
ncbi:hypothetical protein GCM10008986_07920 [Salinibacillus aidingensis]|uniref:Uncharacterized protein n=1 Tax=Salinibacillus aidingensis TaxID=237684 RepID=A0ABP3KRL1_9BACI